MKRKGTSISLENIQAIMLGIALGDSLGLAVETLSAQQISRRFGRVTDFLDLKNNKFFRNQSIPNGTYSDDAQLSAALFEAYVIAGEFSIEEIAKQHIIAYQQSTLGWGGSTVAGVEALMAGLTPNEADYKARLKAGTGNGIPMKIAAVAAWSALKQEEMQNMPNIIERVCSISHPTSISASAGLAHIAAIRYCLEVSPAEFSKAEFIKNVVAASALGRSIFPGTLKDDLTSRLELLKFADKMSEQQIIERFGGGDCYVYNSLPFSYAFFLRQPDNFETLLDSINAGGDTDSNAAIIGALLGALHGRDIFPIDLCSKIIGISELLDLSERFYQRAVT